MDWIGGKDMSTDRILKEYLIADSLRIRGYISDEKFEELKIEIAAKLAQEGNRPWYKRWFFP